MKLGDNSSPSFNLWHSLPPVQRIDEAMRGRINAARVICVLLMVYVHVPGGLHGAEVVAAELWARFDYWIQLLLVEGTGRASAALLSTVSGYLIAVSLLRGPENRSKKAIFTLYKRRATSVVLPMVVWGIITCLVYMVVISDGTNFVDQADGVLAKLNLVFFITDTPYGPTMHLGFLRDLFVCVLLSPLLLLLLRIVPILTLGTLALVYLASHEIDLVIILRPLVVFAFSIGMFLALRRVNLRSLDRYWSVFIALMFVYTLLIVLTHAGYLDPLKQALESYGVSLLESVLYPLCRLTGSLAIWCMLPLINRHIVSRLLASISPRLFAVYCSHFLVLSLLFHGLWFPLFGDRESSLYIVWFLLAPAISTLVAVCMVSVSGMIHPRIATLITGGRVRAKNSAEVKGRKYARTT